MYNRKRNISERFWKKVGILGPDECWLWKAATNKYYGAFTIDGKTWGSNRVAYILTYGNFPDGVEVLHTCVNTLCVNPRHLKLGTRRQAVIERLDRYGYKRENKDEFYPVHIKKERKTPEERFWGKVDKGGDGECWEWLGGYNTHEYGGITVDGKQIGSHVFSYVLHKGAVPDGMVVMHTCDNPHCVNPKHLQAGTWKDNMQDKTEKGRSNYKGISFRLSNEAKSEIIALYATGKYRRTDLAARFSVTQSTIGNVLRASRENGN
jgi:hypothetical protein